MFTDSLFRSREERIPFFGSQEILQETEGDSPRTDNSNLDLEIGLVQRITRVLTWNRIPIPQQSHKISRDLCLNNEEILSEIISFVSEPQCAEVCKIFNEAWKNASFCDKEIAFLLDMQEINNPIKFKIAYIYKLQLEKSLRWLNPQIESEFKSRNSDLSLVPYTKTILQEISTTKPLKPYFHSISDCSIMVSVASLILSGSNVFWSTIQKSLISNHPDTRYFNVTTQFGSNKVYDSEELKFENSWLDLFSIIMLVSFFAFLSIAIVCYKTEKRKKLLHRGEVANYLITVNKCTRIVQERAPSLQLNPPEMRQVNNQIPHWFRDTYARHPQTRYIHT